MLKAWVSLTPLLSTAFTVKLNVPADAGDPLMLPPLDNDRLDGSRPESTLQL
jgi:hypothetical protein